MAQHPNQQRIALRPLCRMLVITIAFITFTSPYFVSFFSTVGLERFDIRRILTKSISQEDDYAPTVAWIVSYPMSGHNYLIDTFQSLTKRSTASNYGHVVEEVNGRHNRMTYLSEPLFLEHDGPFIFSKHLPLPVKTFIPTLTYCGGYCIDCYPGKYILNREEFMKSCLTGIHFEPSKYNDGENGYGVTTEVKYHASLVKRAIHLIRNPFRIVELRFLYYSHYYDGELDWSILYKGNSEGLYTFCNDAKEKFADEEKKWLWSKDYTAAANVPCHHEFYKIIQWHNYVIETLDYMNIPYEHFYFEDFTYDYENQVRRFFDFFAVEPISKVMNNKQDYGFNPAEELFHPEDKLKIKTFIETVATNKTLALLNRYLKDL